MPSLVNPHRQKQIEEFRDVNHKVMDDYYDTVNANLPTSIEQDAMEWFIVEDVDFYDPYIVLADILEEKEKWKEAEKVLKIGFERAVLRIVDKQGNFPKSLSWLWLENRHIIRIIARWAQELWWNNNKEDALYLLRKLLHSNPNDNIGARYDILAIRLGLEPDYETLFESKDMQGYMNAGEVMDWFDKESKKFPDEFEWWQKKVQKNEK